MKKLLRRALDGAFSAVDEAVLSAMRARFRDRPAAHGAPIDRKALLLEAVKHYQQPDVLAGTRFFVKPPIERATEQRVGTLPGGEVVDLEVSSSFLPGWDRVRSGYSELLRNRRSHVRLYRHHTPRPTAVCLHGYLGGGSWRFESEAFQARWLYGLGLDVALFVLPFHGPRAQRGINWPSLNIGLCNEGFAHAIHDLRSLAVRLRAAGAPAVGVIGMSLGGYTAALWATVDPLDFFVGLVPVSSLPDLWWAHGAGWPERARAEHEGITLDLVRSAMEVHSPLERRSRVAPERALIISSAVDRIVPPEHAARLARHFGAAEKRLVGGHIMQVARKEGFGAIARLLAEAGLVEAR